ncbi:hypothetical protein H0H92_009725 [Tricholoma furcatifolium]|nr:hypothetical protein H0H92_009725 [Tricholoma furcatifolium]
MHGAGTDIFTANMYFVEVRILCRELVAKRGASWARHYVTDVPNQVPEIISQCRRWLNGHFFAAVHSMTPFYIYRSAHTFLRKFGIRVEMLYSLIFSKLLHRLLDPHHRHGRSMFYIAGIKIVIVIVNYSYVGLLIMCFILSLGNRPQGLKWEMAYTMAFVGPSDVPWGTKGEKQPQTDLSKVELKPGTAKNEVEVANPPTRQDIDALNEDAILC